MMNIELIREDLKNIYNRPNWSEKVDKMSDAQALAVHGRLVNEKPKPRVPGYPNKY